MPDLTVAICTYRRIEPFRETLDSLAACASPGCTWELLIIDNAGDPAVERLVDDWADHHGDIKVRYEVESQLGTSNARNHAIASARAPIVAFTDDDVTFEPTWLARLWQAVLDHPECMFWGGRVEPLWLKPPPVWFDPRLCPMLGDTIVQYRRGEEPRAWDLRDDPPFYTANLALRVDAMQQAGGFDTSVGHRGGVRIGAEDSLMVKAIANAGGKGWYAADAVVHHPVPEDRMTKQYARQFAWRQGWIGLEMLRREVDPTGQSKQRVPRWVYRAAASQMLRGMRQWLSGMLTGRPALAFAGRIVMTFASSKLYHAIFGWGH
jgi:glycosyltransferase involved in cell wall biosynthesis